MKNDLTLDDFSLSADINPVSGHAGLVFRANAAGADGYRVLLNREIGPHKQ